jgi:diadenosine tetraphosphate (Ap4A) HIT family hydrolase
VWEFPSSVAVLGPWQFFHGYCVLVSKRHANELHELSAEERTAFLGEMWILAAAIHRCVSPRKMNYELLGNQVSHLHWHLFPRFADDPEHLKPAWVALDRAERDAAERQRMERGPMTRKETISLLREGIERQLSSE